MRVNLRQVVKAIANAVDLVGIDDLLHSRRVAVMAVECAKRMGWDWQTQNLVFDAGLLHDCGVSSTRVHRTLIDELDWEAAHIHCERGYNLLADFAPLAHLAPIVLYHHSHWEDLKKQSLQPTTARFSNLIFLVDRVDFAAAPAYSDNTLLLQAEKIRGIIDRHRNTFFAPDIVDAFLEASRTEAFWLLLDPDFIPSYMVKMDLFARKQRIGVMDLKKFALIIAEIVDAKSHFTRDHSLGVARLTRLLAYKVGVAGEQLDLIEIAALLHDIGKLQIPDEVLESTSKLTTAERSMIKKHAFATYQILTCIGGFDELARWASQHHESLHGGGYPFHMLGGEIPLESRIIKVADVYQALAQERPYRKPMSPAEILDILRRMQADNEIDPMIVDVVALHQVECHKAAVNT
ncbi:MAG: HD domain-containing phosphohydrolase [Syntrophobacteraceae bacterium]|jgi:putative nucleotidyltransferase with HDIG domain